MAVEYGFRALPQTYFVTISRKGELKVVDPSDINILVDETFIRKKC